MRYFIKLSYKGTDYHGWQIQPNARTVQEELQKVFSLLLKEDISVIGAGRTDTGVHAINFFAHFDVSMLIVELTQFIYKVNSFINNDIAIHDIFEVPDDAHARFSALSRTYEYRIHQQKDPFLIDRSLKIDQALDFELMNQSAKYLLDYDDYTSFSKSHTDTKTNNCKIMIAEWIERENQNIFVIKADRFLRNMVRAIVGTLIEVGLKKIKPDDIKKIVESKNRSAAGPSAPAHALILTKIDYPPEIVDIH